MNRNLIGSLAAIAPSDVKICGFVASVRNTKRFIFLVVRDFSGSVQIFVSKEENPELASICSTLTVNSTVEIFGEVYHNPSVKLGGIEILPQKINVVSLAPAELPIDENSSQELKMNWRFLELRAPENRLIFELSTVIEQAMRQYWSDHNFIEIHSPKLMGTSSESGSELFSVPYFGKTAYLAQSPQFYKQMAMNAGFEKVFEIGPVFRANPSFTSRHETEFISVDAEISWIESHEDVMKLEEEWIQYFMAVAAKKLGSRVQELYGKEIIVPSTPFPRIPLATVKEILKKEFGCVSQKENDLSPEEEQLLGQYVEQHYGHDFVFVTDYPVSVRPFYHMRHESNPTLTKSFDLIYRGVEVTTGAQREHRYDVLVSQILEKEKTEKDSKLMESLKDYLTFFQYGSVPHGGFGFGLARLIMKMLGLPNIRAVTLVSRNPKRLTP
jgi:aspartyl-tRNA synthetase